MLLQRVRLFFNEGRFVVLVGLFLIPSFLLYEISYQLWRTVRPVPFKRDEILRLMTLPFGIKRAKECFNGFRRGFVERGYPRCGTGRPCRSGAYIAGRQDGA